MHQDTQFFPRGRLDAVEAHDTVLILGVNAVEKQHVEMHIRLLRQQQAKAANAEVNEADMSHMVDEALNWARKR